MIPASAQPWQSAATVPYLGPEEIHLWQFSLQTSEAHIDRLRTLLSPAEIARAERLIRPADSLRFIVGRATLRQLLGSYLATEPARLEFSTLPQGKPVLAQPRLSFNLSHSGDLALLAIARSVALGVDLELVRPELDWSPLASRYFSKHEQQALRDLAPNQQTEAFFTIWTRKEAWLKAIGSGFHLPFDTFDVSAPPAPAALLRHQGDPAAPSDWQLDAIPTAANYCATLAYPAPQRTVLLLDFASGSH